MSSAEVGQAGPWHGTTILMVRKGGLVAIGGDGQVSIGQTIIKANARKVRRLGGGAVIGALPAPPPMHLRSSSGSNPSSNNIPVN